VACGPMPQVNSTPDAGLVTFAEPVTVNRVIDGDTFEVQRAGQSFRVRMKGVDTPELNSMEPSLPAEPFADEARSFSLAQVGLQVGLQWDSNCSEPFGFCSEGRDDQACFDRYCRKIAYIQLSDGRDLGEELLRAGLARVYRFDNEMFDRLGDYLNAEDEGRQNRRGQWE
jgi:micrococcal nuclease